MSQPTIPLASVPAPAAAAPGTAGSPGSESSQQEQQEHVEQAEVNESTLTDAQLDELITGQPAAPAPAAPAAAPILPDGRQAAPAAETPAAPAPGQPAPSAPAPAAAPEALLAGKYKSTADLKKGILEITKPLGYPQKVIERLVAFAEKTGDWKTVEDTYKELDTALSRDQKIPAAAAPAAPAAPQETQPGSETDKAVAQEMYRVSVDEAYDQVSRSPVAAELAELGLNIPRTKEEWNRLKLDYPYVAFRFDQEFTRQFQAAQKGVHDYYTSLEGLEAHTTQAKATAQQQIKDIAKEYNLEGFDDTRAEQLIAEALKSPQIYEDRNSVQYIRDGAIRDYFIAKEFPNLTKAMKLGAELNGRTQAVKDLEEMRKRNINSISSAPLPGNRIAAPVPGSEDDEAVIARMSDEELDRKIKGA